MYISYYHIYKEILSYESQSFIFRIISPSYFEIRSPFKPFKGQNFIHGNTTSYWLNHFYISNLFFPSFPGQIKPRLQILNYLRVRQIWNSLWGNPYKHSNCQVLTSCWRFDKEEKEIVDKNRCSSIVAWSTWNESTSDPQTTHRAIHTLHSSVTSGRTFGPILFLSLPCTLLRKAARAYYPAGVVRPTSE